MSLINVSNLTFAYDGSYDNIFERVSFQLDTDWRLGFTGRNGRGKTTFLHLLMGKFDYTGAISADVGFDYFPYDVKDPSADTLEVLRAVAPRAEDWRLMRELSLLDVDEDALYRPFSTLSQGEQTKALVCALFLNENRFPLIDEPTNHLDSAAREKLADYLKRKKGFILVSHDRALLDRCIDHILVINKTNIEVQKGNFSFWWRQNEQNIRSEHAQNARLKKDIERLSQSAKRTAAWSNAVEKSKIGGDNAGGKIDRGYVGHKSAKMMKRAKSIEARQQHSIEEKSALLKNVEEQSPLSLSPLIFHTKQLVELQDIGIAYDGKIVLSGVSFFINQGERISLSGKNGAGKSSLLKIVCDQMAPSEGMLLKNKNLIISSVPQSTGHLHGDLSAFARQRGIDESLFKAILRKLDFSRVQFEKDMRDFSAGQKKKTLLAASLCERAHLYVWDEPLNYIDVISRMQIEELLLKFEPTLLFVEHDRAFLDRAATRTILLP